VIVLHNIKDFANGLEANIYNNADGVRFNVVFRDFEAEETISVRIFSDLDAAKAFAHSVFVEAHDESPEPMHTWSND
jgi:hypothetical protein